MKNGVNKGTGMIKEAKDARDRDGNETYNNFEIFTA